MFLFDKLCIIFDWPSFIASTVKTFICKTRLIACNTPGTIICCIRIRRLFINFWTLFSLTWRWSLNLFFFFNFSKFFLKSQHKSCENTYFWFQFLIGWGVYFLSFTLSFTKRNMTISRVFTKISATIWTVHIVFLF